MSAILLLALADPPHSGAPFGRNGFVYLFWR